MQTKPPKVDHSKAVERAMHFQDIRNRAALARPVDTGRDILDLGQFPRLESL